MIVVGSGTKTTLELLMSMTIGSGVFMFAVGCAVLSCDRALSRTESALREPLVVGSGIAVLSSIDVSGSAGDAIGS